MKDRGSTPLASKCLIIRHLGLRETLTKTHTKTMGADICPSHCCFQAPSPGAFIS